MPIVIATLLTNNCSQVVQLPTEAHQPDDAKQVMIRIRGRDRIMTPIENTWDSFFHNGPVVTDDFLNECRIQRPKQVLEM